MQTEYDVSVEESVEGQVLEHGRRQDPVPRQEVTQQLQPNQAITRQVMPQYIGVKRHLTMTTGSETNKHCLRDSLFHQNTYMRLLVENGIYTFI